MHKVEDVLVWTIFLTLGYDALCCRFAHAFDGGKAEPHFTLLVGRELQTALVHIRTLARNAHCLTFRHELGYLRYVVDASAHVACHEFGRVVSFEISRLVGNPRVACGMRLVESVGSELLPIGPYLVKHSRVVTVFLSPFNEFRLHCIYDGFLLLTHRLTQCVRFTACEIGKLARKKHHLLLIYGDSVGVLEVFLHAGDVVCYRLFTVFAGDELRYVVHWAGSVKGVHGDKVLENGRFEFAQVLLHTCRFKLECTYCATLLIEFVGEFIVYWDCVKVDLHTSCNLDVLYGLFHYR